MSRKGTSSQLSSVSISHWSEQEQISGLYQGGYLWYNREWGGEEPVLSSPVWVYLIGQNRGQSQGFIRTSSQLSSVSISNWSEQEPIPVLYQGSHLWYNRGWAGKEPVLSSPVWVYLIGQNRSQSQCSIRAAIFDTIEGEQERNQFSALQCEYISLVRTGPIPGLYQDQFSALQCEYTHIISQNTSQSQVFIRAAIFNTTESEQERNQFSALQCEYISLVRTGANPRTLSGRPSLIQ